MLLRRRICQVLFLALISICGLPSVQAEPNLASLSSNARQLFLATMDLGARHWDPAVSLLRDSPASNPGVRDSASYALGLLLRNAPGDNARAAALINAVLRLQYNAPGKPFDGTFHRNLGEPDAPATGSVIWKDYDPNWREFVGTTFLIILEEFPNRLPKGLASRMDRSIAHAVAGEITNARLDPTYTNPTLMYAILWDYAASRTHRPDWIAQSAAWRENVYRLFKLHDTFNEYNSPTYCGVDLYALSMWRRYGSTARMRTLGAEMEASLWTDLARFYNANLRNLSGPFDRAYGMDMESYVSLVGVALRMELDPRLAPLPALNSPIDPSTDHLGDIWFTPHFAILGVLIPEQAMKSFRGFQGERLVRREITDNRIAEAWVGRQVIFGGEITHQTKGIAGESQFHAATVQWRTPSGEIGWIELTQSNPLDVRADRSGLNISSSGKVRFRIHARGIVLADVRQSQWILPGLTVQVTAAAARFTAQPGTQAVDVEYSGINGMKLHIQPAEDNRVRASQMER